MCTHPTDKNLRNLADFFNLRFVLINWKVFYLKLVSLLPLAFEVLYDILLGSVSFFVLRSSTMFAVVLSVHLVVILVSVAQN